MDHIHTARRSASHGALDKSYTADAFHPHRRPFPRHPLRSVNENVSLLVSPGPLESMLKTTTETGDIGLFSIRPVRSSGSIPAPSRRRPSFGDQTCGRPPNSERLPRGSSSFRDDRIWLPSYRDTTSEIISMYGSDSMRSAASSFAPPFDDRGPRSYSMTTCSSRPIPHQKSTGTMQSHPSDGLLQRPRSPFPYPTRLKRPGVRPSSPALTESGAVDYTRMVAIDRVSRRTVHGSYKPTYPQHNGRPQPRARFDGDRSSEYSSGCNMSPASPVAWGNRYRPRLNSSASEHSLRTSSITSIVNMYQHSTCGPPSRKTSLRAQSPGSFYYDYSEGFDYEPEERPPMPDFPVHISALTRSLCQQRSEVATRLRGSGRYDAAPTPGPSVGYEPYTPQSSVRESEHSEGATDEGQAQQTRRDESRAKNSPFPSPAMLPVDVALEERLAPSLTERPSTAISPRDDDELWSVGTAVVQKRQNANLTMRGRLHMSTPGYTYMSISSSRSCDKNTPYLAPSPAHSSPRPANPHRSLPASYKRRGSNPSTRNEQSRRSRFYSVEPGIADFSSLQDSVNSTPQLPSSNQTFPSSFGQVHNENRAWDSRLTENITFNQANREVPYASVDTAGFRGHKRNLAAPRIHTGNMLTTPEPGPGSVVDRSKTPMLAPHPISPARQLRLQNSVPQLMKALPPRPDGPVKSEVFTGNNSADELECAMRFSPIDLSSITMSKAAQESPETPDHNQDGVYCINQEQQTLDLELSTFAEINSSFVLSTHGTVPEDGVFQTESVELRKEHRNTQQGNGKLKLKVSRGALTRMQRESGGPRRNTVSPLAKTWNDGVSNPEPWVRISLDGGSRDVVRMDSNLELRMEKNRNDPFGVVSTFADDRAPLTPAPPLPARRSGQSLRVDGGASPGAHGPTGVTSPTSIVDVRSSFSVDSCASGKSPQGLRKRLSLLRVRLTESRVRSAELLSPGNGIDEALEGGAYPAPDADLAKSNTVDAEEDEEVEGRLANGTSDMARGDVDVGQHQGRGFRGRMSKWIKSARQAIMGACGGSGKRG
ncbi:hypothetical protein QBC44DRAFT_244442 [Cladorrhinum sp. PSN332]|nr:hypothetical protein QBC44DRAFT_244442 [Cladorrhinum sp. PSN332]